MLISLFNLMDCNDAVFACVVGGMGLIFITLCWVLDRGGRVQG